MTVMNLLETPHPFTVEDLEGMPDDGRRYELIDGKLLVSPAPGFWHQLVSMELSVLLHQACPEQMRVIAAPFAIRPNRSNEVQPDILVARAEDFTEKCLPKAPLLAVEIISRRSRRVDEGPKKTFYQRLQVPRYWLVDPNPDQPALTVFVLADDEYEEVAHVVGEQPYDAVQPYPVRVVPSELLPKRP